ncbi:MAG: tRNA (adenosine(37)-N6)-threonylcarbamoyltransferase complex transferase subunit TsaD [Planctomycetota bacterium]|nr:MAG: tRNA (adenosine(37)-N6)-threonylcarbamoyltransferase complex transferase subunit TsaD [Planctomycetota bacterium]
MTSAAHAEPPNEPTAGTLILGIETSCDETAASIVEWRDGAPRVCSNAISTQHEIHARYAGVVPELASRAHLERIVPMVREAIRYADLQDRRISAVAIGNRPGLIGSLLVGNAAGKAYAWSLGVPVIGIDHIAAHLTAGLLDAPPVRWPALGLVASGGHTHLFRMNGPRSMKLLGRTIDDAIGEAFDKAATLLSLGYPGGPLLDARSSAGDPTAIRFPTPRLTARSVREGGTDDNCLRAPTESGSTFAPVLSNDRTLDFSFSGMKTALLYAVRGVPPVTNRPAPRPPLPLTEQRISDLCASFQAAAVNQVMDVLARAYDKLAAQDDRPATLLVGGGVTANRHLRAELAKFGDQRGIDVRLPPQQFCVDNAAMIAALAHWKFAAGEFDNLRLAPRPFSALGRF